MSIKKILKWGFNYLRLLLLKIRFKNRIIIQLRTKKAHEHPPYIAWSAKIDIGPSSKLILNQNSYISPHCQIKGLENSTINLKPYVYIGNYSRIIARKEVMIQENTLIADNVSLYDHDHRFLDKKTPIAEQGFCASSIYIGRNCWLATNVVVLKGVNITDHVIVGANAVVTKSLDRAGVYGGIPARFIK